ncbi:MAG: hypothetical protein KDD36_07365 [Flavobacteriales bacterium]|nr:hypothetical protein [Flavobacteriales bacterium]
MFLKAIIKRSPSESKVFFKWGVIWMVVSSLGIWSLGVTSSLLGKLHPLFYASVQFFLHFQFNGWFTYTTIGLLIHYLNRSGKQVKIPGYVFVLIQLSLLLTYTLSITWSNPLEILFHLNALGVILQLIGYGLVLKDIFKVLFSGKKPWSTWSDRLILAGLFSLLFKILIQALVVWPSVAVISYTIRNYVIAFIHLIMLGSITFSICGILLKEQVLPLNRTAKTGWILLLAGFLLTEFTLFGQGTMFWMGQGFIPGYYLILLVFTLLIPLSIIFILRGFRTSGKKAWPLNFLNNFLV